MYLLGRSTEYLLLLLKQELGHWGRTTHKSRCNLCKMDNFPLILHTVGPSTNQARRHFIDKKRYWSLSQVESRQWAKTWPLHRELFFLGILNRLRSSQDIGKTSPFRQSAGGTIWNGLHAKKEKVARKEGESQLLGSYHGSYRRLLDYYRHIGNVELTSGHTWKGQETEIKPSYPNLTQFHYRAPLGNT